MSDKPAEADRRAGRRLRWPAFPKPTPVEWICLPVGLFLTIHYSWLLDDAFIYYRYVDNLLYFGYGLVYNAGEYVEGFSSPLWVILLILLRATGLNYWLITRLVGVVAFILFWMMLVTLNRQLSPPRRALLNFPLCYLAFNYGVLCYFTSGVEAPLVQVAAVLYALFVLNPTSRALQLLLAVTPILRHEMAVPFAICLGWAWMKNRTFPLRMVLAGGLITGAWVAFRIYYYADLFPNTFYLKDTTDFAQGLVYLQDTAGPYRLYPVLGALVLLTLVCLFKSPAGAESDKHNQPRARAGRRAKARSRRKRAGGTGPLEQPQTRPGRNLPRGMSLELRTRLMMVVLSLSVAVYVIRIGGDPRHFRFWSFPFCLCLCATSGIVEQLLARFSLAPLRSATTVIGVLVALGSATFYPRQLGAHPFFGRVKHQEVDKIKDASPHRHLKAFPRPPWGSGAQIELKDRYREFLSEHPEVPYREVAQASRCWWIYQRFNVRFVQSLGLTDPILARTEMKADRPAHKLGLVPLAAHLVNIAASPKITFGRGMYGSAVQQGIARRWIADNLPSIEIIERKMFNTHDLGENLRLAFTFPEKIKIPGKPKP